MYAALAVAPLAVVGAIAIAWWAWGAVAGAGAHPTDYGTFLGGTAAPLVALAAFALLVAGFLAQLNQLAAYEHELRANAAAGARATFERTFFELLRFHRDSAVGLLARPRGSSADLETGLPAFDAAANVLDHELAPRTSPGLDAAPATASAPQRPRDYDTVYHDVCLAPHSNFGHYFRTLFYLVDTIDRDPETVPERKVYYARVVRAQLSAAELRVLFYNGLAREGRKSFKRLIERYGLLKGLVLPNEIAGFRAQYSDSAFSDPLEPRTGDS